MFNASADRLPQLTSARVFGQLAASGEEKSEREET
jgi:hypothetical protein